jgi:hypothetical protein
MRDSQAFMPVHVHGYGFLTFTSGSGRFVPSVAGDAATPNFSLKCLEQPDRNSKTRPHYSLPSLAKCPGVPGLTGSCCSFNARNPGTKLPAPASRTTIGPQNARATMHPDRASSAPGSYSPTNEDGYPQSLHALDLLTLNSKDTTNDGGLDHGTNKGPESPQVAASKHELSPERIINTVHQFVREERLRSFRFMGERCHRYMDQEELLVVAPATSDEVCAIRRGGSEPHLDQYVDSTWFTFVEPQVRVSSKRTVAITVQCSQEPTIENLIITATTPNRSLQSMAASTWLRQTYDDTDDWAIKSSQCQYDEQKLWWERNGKAFNILSLPLELREAIYLQIIGCIVVPDLYKSQVVLGNGLSYEAKSDRTGWNRDPDIEPPNMAIMRVSKVIRCEATLVANRDTFKRFRFVGLDGSSATTKPLLRAAPIISAIKAAPPAFFLHRVQLEMSATHAFASVMKKPSKKLHAHAIMGPDTWKLDALKGFPGLRHLDFRFISPKHPDASCPWARRGAKDGEHACQKMWIDWFFTSSWPTLAHLKQQHDVKFTLSGCVKDSRKKYWEQVLNDRREDFAVEMAQAFKRIGEKLDNTPPPCKCSSPCSKADMRAYKTYKWEDYEVRRIEGLQEHIDAMYWDFRD